jgi:hypothetical protein
MPNSGRLRPGRSGSGERAVAMLATWFTVIGGVFCCLFIGLAFDAERRNVLLALGGGCAALSLLSWLLRERRGEPRMLGWGWGNKVRKHRYRLARKSRVVHPVEVAPNRPPTAAELRDLQSHQSTWVPRANPPGRSRD